MSREAGRFYTARFVLEWTGIQIGDLSRLLAEEPDAQRLRSEAVPLALGVVANYRMALEHIAHEVARIACPHAEAERVSFPVAHDAFAYRSMMLTRFPGLRVNHPKIWRRLREAQSFAPGSSGWVEELHGLWNHSLALRVVAPTPPSEPGRRGGRAVASRGPLGPPTLVYGDSGSVTELFDRIAAAEIGLVQDLDQLLGDVDDPEEVLERRYRR